MIKHGKIHPYNGTRKYLEPIEKFVTKGIADAKEKVILQPLACDVKGAKRYNGQQCVIARALNRTIHPQAVAVGRTFAFVVVDGVAVRFALPMASRKLVEEFDQRGRARNAPVELHAVARSWKLGKTQSVDERTVRDRSKERTRPRAKKFGVRAAAGGVTQ